MKNLKVLIVGLGSIALKHVYALKQINRRVDIMALRSSKNAENIPGITNIYSLNEQLDFDFAIISNPTAFHVNAIEQLAPYKKPLFIEKPLFHNIELSEQILYCTKNINTYVAFNLRFLDCLRFLKKEILVDKIQEVNIYCGSYLPEWRENTNYKTQYSAIPEEGGGVHLDLIHELDYSIWLFGKPNKSHSVFRNQSKLSIRAIDYANYVLEYDHFSISIILNYYRRDSRRTCEIVFEDTTWQIDLLKNRIIDVIKNTIIFDSKQTLRDTYLDQMKSFIDIIEHNQMSTSPVNESIENLKIALL